MKLLGRFSAELGTQVLRLHEGSKPQELFIYLLLKRRAHTREEVASVLWEEATPARSRAYLRKALWKLQAALRSAAKPRTSIPFLHVEGEWLRLHPDLPLWLDVAVLEDAYARSRNVPGRDLPPSAADALRDAAALYSGDLLPDRYQSWCLDERERLRHLYLSLLEKLLEFCEEHREYDAGLSYARSILAYDTTCEHIHRQVMRLHCLRGDRASALLQYRLCAEVLAAELDVAPMRETRALCERIRGGDTDLLPPRPSVEPSARALQDIVHRLDHLEVVLGEIRRSVDAVARPDPPPAR